ncbi:MAG TPA: hydroxyacid dehydrogenase [Caldithrix abyssi]|uniref:Hydroxyacid dehydrogenase n=1 Tax=Caldithrix abyssi TaxID=187145 RepID=A0A7V4U026_CALAY|nr:hydroxyacid dehydrogenase [Caldithrix abyssi]
MSDTKNWDIFFYETFEEEEQELRRYLNARIKAGFTKQTIQESGHARPPASFISIRTQSLLPEAWGRQLKAILSRSTGYNHLLAYRNQTQTTAELGYLPLYCNRAVAEQALTLWMNLLRKLPRQIEQFRQFNRDGLSGYECAAKNLLVVGVGNIGHEVVRIGRGMDMQVQGVDIVKRFDDVEYVDIDSGIKEADVIVCAMNLTPQNRGYFNYQVLKKAKPGVIFINIARGELSPAVDLLRLIEEGHLGGLALDVFDEESALAVHLRNGEPARHPAVIATLKLADKPNVIFTPHNAFNTIEATRRKSEQSARQVEQMMETGGFIWPIPEK